MKQELRNQLKEDFPQIFADSDRFGLAIGDGWYQLIYNMCSKIMETKPDPEFKAVQVKSKFGGLRFYVTTATDEVHKIIDKTEQLSCQTCEDCGSMEDVEQGYVTLCKKCR